MTAPLPISIYVCDKLQQQFERIRSVCNKLEAQFNFHTMTANWYGEEDNIFFVQLCLEAPQSFIEKQKLLQQVDTTTYSDDAFSYYDKNDQEQVLICYLSITNTELALLEQQHKLLTGLLQIKLQKVLNLIATQLKLTAI